MPKFAGLQALQTIDIIPIRAHEPCDRFGLRKIQPGMACTGLVTQRNIGYRVQTCS